MKLISKIILNKISSIELSINSNYEVNNTGLSPGLERLPISPKH